MLYLAYYKFTKPQSHESYLTGRCWKVALVNTGSKLTSAVYAALRTLEVGQSLHVLRFEWDTQSLPGTSVPSTIRDGRKFSIKSLSDKSGWLITRTISMAGCKHTNYQSHRLSRQALCIFLQSLSQPYKHLLQGMRTIISSLFCTFLNRHLKAWQVVDEHRYAEPYCGLCTRD